MAFEIRLVKTFHQQKILRSPLIFHNQKNSTTLGVYHHFLFSLPSPRSHHRYHYHLHHPPCKRHLAPDYPFPGEFPALSPTQETAGWHGAGYFVLPA